MKRALQIHVGCSGWFYWHWRKIFYPEGARIDDWFKHYTSSFETVELNAPFYSWPKPATVRGWRRNAPPKFRYSVKVNRIITHEKRLCAFMAEHAGTGTITRTKNLPLGQSGFARAAQVKCGFISTTIAKALQSRMPGKWCDNSMQTVGRERFFRDNALGL